MQEDDNLHCFVARTDTMAASPKRLAVKDVIRVSGLPLTAGISVDIGDLRPATQALVVSDLEAKGLQVVGTTWTTPLTITAVALEGRRTLNIYDPSRTPSGSSAGSAVAVASRLCDIALGTDAGGSVRLPAAHAGVVGYKASPDLFSWVGVLCWCNPFDSIGIIGASLDDIWPYLPCQPTELPAKPLRLIVPDALRLEDLDQKVLHDWQRAIGELANKGVDLSYGPSPIDVDADDLYRKLSAALIANWIGPDRLREWKRAGLNEIVQRRADIGMTLIEAIPDLLKSLNTLRSGWRESKCLWVTPTAPTVAARYTDMPTVEKAGEWSWNNSRYTRPVNVVGGCAVSIPISSEGLPTSLQIFGGPGEDEHLLASAKLIASCLQDER